MAVIWMNLNTTIKFTRLVIQPIHMITEYELGEVAALGNTAIYN